MESHKVILLFWKIPKNLELATFTQFWVKGCTYNVHHYETFVVNNPSSRPNQDFIKLHKKWSFPVSGKRLLITLSKNPNDSRPLVFTTSFGFHKIVEPKERYEFVENQDFIKLHKKNGAFKERYEFVENENQDFIKLPKKRKLSKSGTTLWRMKIKTLFGFPKIRKPKKQVDNVVD